MQRKRGAAMFGYVRLYKPEAKMREYEYYRGVYCSLCRALGRCGGQCARLTLQYDVAFLALVRLALEEHEVAFCKKRCIAHPFRAHTEAKRDGAIDFCAYASTLLTYHKILDDKTDERGGKRLAARLVSPVLKGNSRRARRLYPELDVGIRERLSALAAFEESGERSIDKPAILFGEVMAFLLSFGLSDSAAKIASTIGRYIGKWVYLADAADDYEEDVRRGRYNPIAQVYGNGPLSAAVWETVKGGMIASLMEAEKAFDLLQYSDEDMRGVVHNVLYVGMPNAAREILAKKERLQDE